MHFLLERRKKKHITRQITHQQLKANKRKTSKSHTIFFIRKQTLTRTQKKGVESKRLNRSVHVLEQQPAHD